MGIKINLIGMILTHMGRRQFEGLIIDDDGKELDAESSLDFLITEHAKVKNGGESKIVAVPSHLVIPK